MADFDDMLTNYDGDNQLEFEKANVGMRIGAFIIDHIMIVTVLVCPFILFIFSNIQKDPISAITMFPAFMVVAFLSYCLKDMINGASLGKRALGLAVRNSANTSEIPSVPKLFLRNILTFIWPVEFFVLVCSAKKRKPGDQMAGTDVYRLTRKPKIAIIVITVILAITIFVGSLVVGIASILKNDSSYKTAVSYIEVNPEITNYVGEIKGYGYIPSGSLNYSGNYGQALYTIKVIGSKNTIYVHMEMEKKPEKDWEITYFDYKK